MEDNKKEKICKAMHISGEDYDMISTLIEHGVDRFKFETVSNKYHKMKKKEEQRAQSKNELKADEQNFDNYLSQVR